MSFSRNRSVSEKNIFNKFKKEYFPKEAVPESAIYECSACENITAFKQGERFARCPDCPKRRQDQGWYRTNEFVHFVTRNLNDEYAHLETVSVRIAESIANFAGNIWFVYFHVVWFGLWIWLNTGERILTYGGFDPYPFPFLVLVVSLEAIFLATFILIAQSIQSTRSELRAELDYQTNLKVEKDVAEALSILNDIREGKFTLQGKRITLEEKK